MSAPTDPKKDDQSHQFLAQPLNPLHQAADPYDLYNQSTAHEEKAFVEECNQSMDTLLVFAGLFSAVTTGLLAETYKDLKPAPEAYMEVLLENIFKRQGDPFGRYPEVARPSFSPSRRAIATNTLFFSSLSFSLISALGAILVKQWTRRVFLKASRHESIAQRARKHYKGRSAIDKWHLSKLIAFIPMILHFALACFFAGLVVWLQTLDKIVFAIIATIAGVTCALYVATAITPSFWPDSPYRWPASDAIRVLTKQLPAWRSHTDIPLLPLKAATAMRVPNAPIVTTSVQRVEAINRGPIDNAGVDEIDLHLYARILESKGSFETEAVLNALRFRLSGTSITTRGALPANDPSLAFIIEKAAETATECQVYHGGKYDIRAGISLERVITLLQFLEVALQAIDFDSNPKLLRELPFFLDIATLMLERAMHFPSAPEIALCASVVVRLERRLGKWDHLEKAENITKALRDLAPKTRPRARPQRSNLFDDDDSDVKIDQKQNDSWTYSDVERWQGLILPYLLALSYLVQSRFPSGDNTAADHSFTFFAEAAGALVRDTCFPLNSGRTDSHSVLRDGLEALWISTQTASPRFLVWMSQVMDSTGSTPIVSGDGTHSFQRWNVNQIATSSP
ncbi:hypothetical protein FRC17_003757 [Serendipita sp. 399]|nr:hypothetical protein FRC17_003757 [Serendipita sp. 399]